MTAIALLTLIGLPVAGGSTLGVVIALLVPGRVKLSVNILKAASAGLKNLKAPDRDPTRAEIEAMRRMDMFG